MGSVTPLPLRNQPMTFAADRPSQPYPRLFPWLVLSAALLVAVGSVHWRFQEVPLGVLYVLPMLAAALVLNRWQVILFGVLLAIVRSAFLPSEPLGGTALRFLLGLAAYAATGLFVVEMVRNKTLWLRYHQEISAQEQLVVEAQTDLKMLAESSPAAIFTLDDQARVVSGNQAASALFGVTPEALLGHQAKESLPVLADALKFSPGTPTFRTAAQCQGQRADGERFLAPFPQLAVTTEVARSGSRIRRTLRQRGEMIGDFDICLLYTSPSPRD
mgnify:CR=1 FL=1